MSHKWYVYILKCADGSLYTGMTNDLSKRLKQHNLAKGARYTSGRLPVELLWSEATPSKGEALKREIQIKKLSRLQKEFIIKSIPTN